MGDDLSTLKDELTAAASGAADLAALEEVRVRALGKKGAITERMKGLGAMEAEARKAAGQALNALRGEVAEAIEARKAALEDAELDQRLATERIDITLPVRPEQQGRIHPISQTIDEVVSIFGEMGFTVAEGPDIEKDWYNFTALNIPPDHPARQMHDTFYLAGTDADEIAAQGGVGGAAVLSGEDKESGGWLLRTHTSPVQVRTMEEVGPPIRILVPGRTYRCDSDMTHTPMFHQFEGLVVDEKTHMGHLKGCLIEFCRAYFEVDDVPVRFRPSHFPFTEPSAELDIGCSHTRDGIKIGAGDDWLEILGCGMVHPKVLANCGIDPEKYQGFAFGMGTERIAMLKYGIPDLRTFFDADLRWLKHYGFVPLEVPSLTGGLAL
ncbi:MAG: phenylalanine--tRNA ligase subunit alpha [Alphaproteobacteria bacterium]|nr:phenylalanine--tRNA ligase subunit alpha [Alphaproteobacteria bacterium]